MSTPAAQLTPRDDFVAQALAARNEALAAKRRFEGVIARLNKLLRDMEAEAHGN